MASTEQPDLKLQDHGPERPVYPPIEEGKLYSKEYVFETTLDASDFVKKVNPFITKAWHEETIRVQVRGGLMAPLDKLAAEHKGRPVEGDRGEWSDRRWV
jgi:hypothetical protein